MNKILIVLALALLSACAGQPQAVDVAAAAPACQNLEASTGSNRLTRGKCVTVDERDQEAARSLADRMQNDQMQRSLPRPGASN